MLCAPSLYCVDQVFCALFNTHLWSPWHNFVQRLAAIRLCPTRLRSTFLRLLTGHVVQTPLMGRPEWPEALTLYRMFCGMGQKGSTCTVQSTRAMLVQSLSFLIPMRTAFLIPMRTAFLSRSRLIHVIGMGTEQRSHNSGCCRKVLLLLLPFKIPYGAVVDNTLHSRLSTVDRVGYSRYRMALPDPGAESLTHIDPKVLGHGNLQATTLKQLLYANPHASLPSQVQLGVLGTARCNA